MTTTDNTAASTGSPYFPGSAPGPHPKLWVMWVNAALSWSLLAFVYLIYLTIRNISWAKRNRVPWLRYAAPLVTVFAVTATMVGVGIVVATLYLGSSSPVIPTASAASPPAVNSSQDPNISGVPTRQETAAPPQAGSVPVDPAKVAALTTKVTANPQDTASLQALGDLYFASQDYRNATTWERKVLGVDPKNQVALLALGAAQFNLGNAVEAKKTWLTAADLYPNVAEVHYDLGFLYMSQTPPDNAKMQAEWKKVVAIDPNSNLAKTVATHIKSN
jgi:tetratricopeptide (TPR) repeat protein